MIKLITCEAPHSCCWGLRNLSGSSSSALFTSRLLRLRAASRFRVGLSFFILL